MTYHDCGDTYCTACDNYDVSNEKSQVEIIDCADSEKFKEKFNVLYKKGYRPLSTNSGIVQSEAYEDQSFWQAIMVLKED